MTTKTPSPVRPAAATALEKIAYASCAELPTAEPRDNERLGYTLWMWLTHRRDPLDLAVRAARARLLISEDEAVRRIRQRLTEHGVSF